MVAVPIYLDPGDKLSKDMLAQAEAMLKGGPIKAEQIIEILGHPVKRGPGGVRNSNGIPFNHKLIPFDFNSARIKEEAIPQLREIGKAFLSEGLSSIHFLLEGNTDVRGSDERNMKLGWDRANSVKSYLKTEFDISPQRIITISSGKKKPICSQDTEACHALNRRVVVGRIEEEEASHFIEMSKKQGKRGSGVVERGFLSGFLYEKKGEGVAMMYDGMTLTEKDNYKIYFRPHESCYVYIIQVDPSGIEFLFPNPEFGSENITMLRQVRATGYPVLITGSIWTI